MSREFDNNNQNQHHLRYNKKQRGKHYYFHAVFLYLVLNYTFLNKDFLFGRVCNEIKANCKPKTIANAVKPFQELFLILWLSDK